MEKFSENNDTSLSYESLDILQSSVSKSDLSQKGRQHFFFLRLINKKIIVTMVFYLLSFLSIFPGWKISFFKMYKSSPEEITSFVFVTIDIILRSCFERGQNKCCE